MILGSTVYLRRFKQVKVLRGTVTGQPLGASQARNVHTVELDNGTTIGAVSLAPENQDRLAALYQEQTS